MKKGVKYDYKEAYNKKLKPSARLHYLENARHDQDSPAEMGHKSPAKMGHKSPAKKYGSPMEKHCTPMKKYKSPMKMGGHAIHKHMGGGPFHKAGNPDLEYMPVVKDATGQRKGTTGDPVMDEYHSRPMSEQTSSGTVNKPSSSSSSKSSYTNLSTRSKNTLNELNSVGMKSKKFTPSFNPSAKSKKVAEPTRRDLRRSNRADRIEQRISKKQKQLNKFGSSYDKARAKAKAGRIAKMQKRADRLK